MGQGRSKGQKKGGRRGWERAEPLGVRGNSRGREASGVYPKIHGVGEEEGGREASRVEENPGGGRHGVGGGVELSQDDSTRHGEGGGVNSSQDDSTPNRRGGGVKLWQDNLTQNGMGGGVESSQDDLTPRGAEGPRGDETLGALTASHYRRGKDGRWQGGGDEKPPTA